MMKLWFREAKQLAEVLQLPSVGAEIPVLELPELEASALIRMLFHCGKKSRMGWGGGTGHCNHASCSQQMPLCP